jgi:hypothetical protein
MTTNTNYSASSCTNGCFEQYSNDHGVSKLASCLEQCPDAADEIKQLAKKWQDDIAKIEESMPKPPPFGAGTCQTNCFVEYQKDKDSKKYYVCLDSCSTDPSQIKQDVKDLPRFPPAMPFSLDMGM